MTTLLPISVPSFTDNLRVVAAVSTQLLNCGRYYVLDETDACRQLLIFFDNRRQCPLMSMCLENLLW